MSLGSPLAGDLRSFPLPQRRFIPLLLLHAQRLRLSFHPEGVDVVGVLADCFPRRIAFA